MIRLIAGSLFTAANLFSLVLPLEVKETAKINRVNVPVQSGIPLPMGAFQASDLSKFMVLDSTGPKTGSEVASDFWVTATWRDGSIRFLNVQFQANVPASSSRIYYLADKNANTLGTTLTASAAGGTVDVETGVLKFKVKSTGFNLIDEAFIDLSGNKNYTSANQVVQTGHNGGFVINGQRSSGGNATVTLFRQTAERVVVKATGTVGTFPYIVYITAFRGKPYVQITHNFYYDNSNSGSSVQLSNVSLELPTLLTGDRTVSAGNSVAVPEVSFSQATGEAAYVASTSADRTANCYTVYKGSTAQGTGGSVGNVNVGWMQVSKGAVGLGLGIRYFWEMYPKVIEMTANGTAILGLYNYKAAALQYYAGGGRTHSAMLCFGNDAGLTKEAYFTLSQPLYAMAPPVWMCGFTQSVGDLIHGDASLLVDNTDPLWAKYNYFFNITLKRAQAMNGLGIRYTPSNLNVTNPVKDLFGFIAFGDNTDPTNGYCFDQQHYSGNYYDYPHVCILSYVMNGEKEALIRASECALQMADIEHFNTTGDARGCPVVDHWFSYQNPSGSPAQCLTPVQWGNANHWKTESLFETYWFTGDPIYLDLGKRINKFVKNNNGAITTGQARSAGHVLMGLSHEYEAEWDVAVRDRMRWFWANGVQSFTNSAQTRESDFLNGIVLEGLVYAIRADPEYTNWRTGLQNMVTSLIGSYQYSGHFSAQSTTPDLCAAQLGGYAMAMDSIPSLVASATPVANDLNNYFFSDVSNFYKVQTSRQKLYVEMTRAIQHWFHRKVKNTNYLANYPDYKNGTATVKVEKGSPLAGMNFEVAPNPFSARTSIAVRGLAATGGRPEMKVYDIKGRLVDALAPSAASLGTGEFTWFPKQLPSGVYIIKFSSGSVLLEKPITLIK